jgi:hypothetical protein
LAGNPADHLIKGLEKAKTAPPVLMIPFPNFIMPGTGTDDGAIKGAAENGCTVRELPLIVEAISGSMKVAPFLSRRPCASICEGVYFTHTHL